MEGGMMDKLEIYTLGGVQILHAGEPVAGLSTRKAEALLIYLASTRRQQPREVLADLLWDERTQSQAMGNLRGVLTNLRQVLGDTLLITRDQAGINPEVDVWLDATELEDRLAAVRKQGNLSADTAHQAAAALELYKGEFLQGFSVFDCRGFEDWSVRERERLHHLVVDELSELINFEIEQKEYQPGMAYAARLLELDTLMESAYRQMMTLLAFSGQRVAALNQYEACQKLLRDELGVEPEEETRGLYEQIRAGKPLVREESVLTVETASLKKVQTHRHNLPVQPTSFIGREREMDEIKKLLAGTHLLTLTGIGGTGKTRLALQVAVDLIDEFPNGVWLVELAALRDPALLEQTIITVLGVHGQPERSLSDLLVNYMQDKHLLLILDNCEHVVEASAQLADLLLRTAPNMKILATSRVHMNLSGETTYSVPPLSLPDLHRATPTPALVQCEAVCLFIERATAAQPSFSLTNENAPAVAQICTHLDGIPLAIELAVARIHHLSPEQISARLGDRFNLLTGGTRTALPRQQTLRAAMDWSYDLLSESERNLFNRLAVFAGSFSLEAVESICANEGTSIPPGTRISSYLVIDMLGALVDHSLVSVLERNGEKRYSLLETVRQYALEKLQAVNELATLQDKHLAYYLGLAQEGKPHSIAGEPTWTDRFEAEYDNYRATMEYAIVSHPEAAILLLDSLGYFIDYTGRNREAYCWAMDILAIADTWAPCVLRAKALMLASWHADIISVNRSEYLNAYQMGEASLQMARETMDKNQINDSILNLQALNYHDNNWLQMQHYAEQHLVISRELGDKLGIASALWAMGESIAEGGDHQTGRMYLEQSLEMGRQMGSSNTIAFDLESLGRIAFLEGDKTRAKACYLECAQIRREIGFQSASAEALYSLGRVLLQEGDAIQAKAQFEECHLIYNELKSIFGQVIYLFGMAGVAVLMGQYETATYLFAAIEFFATRLDILMSDISHQVFDPLIATTRERLGETEFNRMWAEGRQLTLEQALELAQQ
jgi:predicted ATPase/DNA-binding SARP family transcriptional activator